MTNKFARRLIALTVAYAVTSHAMLAGLLVLAMAAPEICASAGTDPIPDSIPKHPYYTACPVLCGSAGTDGIAPNTFAVAAPQVSSFGIDRHVALVTPGSAWRRLPPSRAPPAA